MSPLSPQDKARIRAEEEARIRAEEEARYRAEVRRQLDAERAAGQAEADSAVVRDGEHFVWGEGESHRVEPVRAPAPHPAHDDARVMRKLEVPRQAPPEPRREPPQAPAPEPPRATPARPPRPGPWWLVASLSLVAGLGLVIAWLLMGGGPAAASLELELSASGALFDVPPPTWRPEDLDTPELVLGPDGRVSAGPSRALSNFEQWRAAFEQPVPVMNDPFPSGPTLAELERMHRDTPPPAGPRLRLLGTPEGAPTPEPVVAPTPDPPTPPDPPTLPDPPPAGASAMPALLAYLPAGSWFALGVDARAALHSPTLAKLHALLARELGTTAPLTELGGRDLLAGATHLAYAVTQVGDLDDDFIVSAVTAAAPMVRDRALAAGATPNAGALTWLALPRGEALVVDDGPPARFALARTNSVTALLGALGGAALTSGELGPVVAPVVDAAVFAVMRLQPEQGKDLERMVAGLGAARTVAASVRVSAPDPSQPPTLSARLDLAFGDAAAAETARMNLERARAEAAASPEAALLGRIAPSVHDATLTLELTLSEPELSNLLRGAGLDE